MKKFTLSLMLAFAALLAFPIYSYAQVIPDDEEEIVIINQDQNGNGLGRNLLSVPIEATYFCTLSYVDVVFLDNIGIVTITLTNLTTGGTAVTQTDSGFGGCLVPVTLGSGFYRISFVVQDGASYEGYFTVF